MQFPLLSTAYCNSSNHVVYEEFHCQQPDDANQGCAECGTTFSHAFIGPVCVKLNDAPGEPLRYFGWFEGCADDHSGALTNGEGNSAIVADDWTAASGSYAIYGLDNTPAEAAAECLTDQTSGVAFAFGDLVPDSCCQMADMSADVESHFSNRNAPCGLFPLKFLPATMQFPLLSTAYCDSSNHVVYEEFHCQQPDDANQGCAECGTTFSHAFTGPVCVKLNDAPGEPLRYFGWFEGCEEGDTVESPAGTSSAFKVTLLSKVVFVLATGLLFFS